MYFRIELLQDWIRVILLLTLISTEMQLPSKNTYIKEGFLFHVFRGSHCRCAWNDRFHLSQFNNALALFILPRVVVSQLSRKKDEQESEYEALTAASVC